MRIIKYIELKLGKWDELSSRERYSVMKELHEAIERKLYDTYKSNQISDLYRGEDMFTIAADDHNAANDWAERESNKAKMELEHMKGLFMPRKEWYDAENYFIFGRSTNYVEGLF